MKACRTLSRHAGESRHLIAALSVAPRSAYLLGGPARREWEHSIAAIEGLRYSITLRSLRGA